jgi:hypothetical protein
MPPLAAVTGGGRAELLTGFDEKMLAAPALACSTMLVKPSPVA